MIQGDSEVVGDNWYGADAWAFAKEGKNKISKGIGYIANEFVAIKNDTTACVNLLKTMRYTVIALRTLRGEGIETSDNAHNWEVSINLLEGMQFFDVLKELFHEEDESEIKEEVPLHEKIATIAYLISDGAGGVLWLIEIGIPLLGPFSESIGVIGFITHLSSGTALVGFVIEGGAALVELWDLWDKDDPKKYSALLMVAERTAGAVSIILNVAGLVSPPVVIGFGIAASTLGVVRFVYNRHYVNESELNVN